MVRYIVAYTPFSMASQIRHGNGKNLGGYCIVSYLSLLVDSGTRLAISATSGS
jgi:hypothetical protein